MCFFKKRRKRNEEKLGDIDEFALLDEKIRKYAKWIHNQVMRTNVCNFFVKSHKKIFHRNFRRYSFFAKKRDNKFVTNLSWFSVGIPTLNLRFVHNFNRDKRLRVYVCMYINKPARSNDSADEQKNFCLSRGERRGRRLGIFCRSKSQAMWLMLPIGMENIRYFIAGCHEGRNLPCRNRGECNKRGQGNRKRVVEKDE